MKELTDLADVEACRIQTRKEIVGRIRTFVFTDIDDGDFENQRLRSPDPWIITIDQKSVLELPEEILNHNRRLLVDLLRDICLKLDADPSLESGTCILKSNVWHWALEQPRATQFSQYVNHARLVITYRGHLSDRNVIARGISYLWLTR